MVEYATVRIAQGELRGKKTTTKSGGPLNSFQGIPYAKPPVGSLRFKAPQPPEPWNGVRDALQEGSPSPHLHLLTNEYVGDEDCLFLNVYTPKVPENNSESLIPVMVWIHGGGFMQGSGDSDFFGPDYLVDAGVLLVTLNYRLGPLGYLSLENDEVSGNAGMKDQIAALRWVQKNISNFGGDPNNVTIFGESAGSVSVHFHLLSPMSKGLFKRAICQSGTCLINAVIARNPLARAFQVGEALGCKTEKEAELLTFLRQVDPQQLIEKVEALRLEEIKRMGSPFLFCPTIETPVQGEEAYLLDEPSKLISEGKFHRVPFMAGVTSHEGLLMLKGAVESPAMLGILNNAFEKMVPQDLKKKIDPQRVKDVANRIKKFYFGDQALSQETVLEYAHLNSDLYFVWGTHNTMKIQSSFSSEPIFYYKFSFDGALNMFKKHIGASRFPGACHADDLFYLFSTTNADVEVDADSPEMKLITRMVKLWTNFAKSGNPTPGEDSDLPVKWSPYTTSDPAYLNIDKELTMERHLEKERMEFWEGLYKLTMTEYVTVTIPQGDLRGRKKTTRSGGTYCSFQGIPYAQPPVGPLRFKAPQPPQPWNGTRDALQEGSPCPHIHMITNEFVGDEDCLFINVYTPKMPVNKSGSLIPVMVWIHGGAFKQGSGDTDLYDPDYLVDAGVVIVTFNYRLGALGFLSLENSKIPGNAGLKDQVLALRWVQKNISFFGGDPNNVTIFGESAGAISVHMQLLSPMSKGLFKRAICQSGTSISAWVVMPNPRTRAFQLGEALGCNTTSEEEVFTILMQTEPKQLIDATEKLGLEQEKNGGTQLLFVPSVEAVVEGQEAFLLDQPLKLLSEGKFHQVPFLSGVNSHEGLLVVKGILENPSVLDVINNAFEMMVPQDLKAKLDPTQISDIASRIKKFYFGDQAVAVKTIPEYVNLSTDLYFIWEMHNTMKILASFSTQPIYYYKFSFDGVLNLFKKFVGASKYQGACHADDLSYLFICNAMDVKVDPLSPERKLITRMVNMWTNFAKTGNPTPGDDTDLPVKWKPYTSTDPAYLHINKELTVESHLEKERMAFWEELYKLYQ